MADPGFWILYYRLFDPPEDPRAQNVYHRLLNSSEHPQDREFYLPIFGRPVDPATLLPSELTLWEAYRRLFQHRPRKYRSWEPHRLSQALKDPYVLAHQYPQYMAERPKRRTEANNPYYEKLLANQDDPPKDATDNKSRAIRYAKEHYECFYEVGQVNMIVDILDRQEYAPMQPSLEDQKNARLARLYQAAEEAREQSEMYREEARHRTGLPSPHSRASVESGGENHATTSRYYPEN